MANPKPPSASRMEKSGAVVFEKLETLHTRFTLTLSVCREEQCISALQFRAALSGFLPEISQSLRQLPRSPGHVTAEAFLLRSDEVLSQWRGWGRGCWSPGARARVCLGLSVLYPWSLPSARVDSSVVELNTMWQQGAYQWLKTEAVSSRCIFFPNLRIKSKIRKRLKTKMSQLTNQVLMT